MFLNSNRFENYSVIFPFSFIKNHIYASRLTNGRKKEILNTVVKKFAEQTLRTIAIAYKEISLNSIIDDSIDLDLTLIGIIGIMDPLRDDVPKSISVCQKAGIVVRIVTGDNIVTAVAIAKKAGILRDSYEMNEVTYEVMEGDKFMKLCGGLIEVSKTMKNGEEKKEKKIKNLQVFKTIAAELRVLARSSPIDKQTLVCGLKELKNIVAVTGFFTKIILKFFVCRYFFLFLFLFFLIF